MSAYFRKSFKVAPGVHINLSKRGTGVSFGGRGAHVSFSPTGRVTKTLSIPGTGIYYRDVTTANSRSNKTSIKAAPTESFNDGQVTEGSGTDITNKTGSDVSQTIIPTAHHVEAVEHHGFYISHGFAALLLFFAATVIQNHYGLHPMNAWEPPLIAIGAISLILWLRDLAQSAKERKRLK
jgi:Protein of unknown function (DUF4236)